MTLFDIKNAVCERYKNAEVAEICQIVNELERRLISEIFSPCGIEGRIANLNPETDLYLDLLLTKEHILLYVYYAFWVLSIKEMDLDAANAYASVFNEKFNSLAIFYRRKYIPVKNTKLIGGV